MHLVLHLVVAAAIVLAVPSPARAAGDAGHSTVLTIHTDAAHFPANPLVDAGIREALASGGSGTCDYFAEYLHATGSNDDTLPAFRDYLRQKYHGRHLDVVIVTTTAALRFLLTFRQELFPDVPIVFSAISAPDAATRATGGGITGVTVGVAYAETLALALRLHPETEQVFVVAKADAESVESARAELAAAAGRVRLTFVTEPTVPGLLSVIRAVPAHSIVLYLWHSPNDPGSLIYADAIARLVAQAAPVPVYGTSDLYLGSGVVGGVVRTTRDTGIRLGTMAASILSGTAARDIAIERALLHPVFDSRQLQRWGIDPRRLPQGADLRFREPTIWESYGHYVVTAVLVIAAQLTLIAGLLTERSSRRRAERTLRAKEATLRNSFTKIRQLNARLMTAEETARADLARELHDGTCQDLVGISIAIDALRRTAGYIQDPATQNALTAIRDSSAGAVEAVRRLSHDLHPATLRLVSLTAALRAHCVEAEHRYDVQVGFRTRGDLGTVPADVSLCLFRIGQEALRNGAVHGEARRITVALVAFDGRIELTVIDDGTGFDLAAASYEGSGLGLISMEERARVIGGDLHIETAPGHGTTVRARVPIATPFTIRANGAYDRIAGVPAEAHSG